MPQEEKEVRRLDGLDQSLKLGWASAVATELCNGELREFANVEIKSNGSGICVDVASCEGCFIGVNDLSGYQNNGRGKETLGEGLRVMEDHRGHPSQGDDDERTAQDFADCVSVDGRYRSILTVNITKIEVN
uniref:Uncharacterized protein n=1 Tax=Oryza glaberrima TaxID=4538 RepID=I1QZD6_ORYGL